jgi:citrate lyase beta subunit
MTSPLDRCRSLLYTPGVYPDRFGKAAEAGADGVIIDLEDGVAAGRKDEARAEAVRFLQAPAIPGPLRALRVNGLRTRAGLRDLTVVLESGAGPDVLVLPKCESAAEVRVVDALLAEARHSAALLPMIESVAGLREAEAVAGACGRVAGLMLGGADLAAELGVEPARDSLLPARWEVVRAAAAAGVPAIDMPRLDVDDEAALEQDCAAARRLGFAGKSAIHPRQVAAINRAFTPTAEQLARARQVVEAFEAGGGEVCLVEGRLVEEPIVRAARRLLARSS